MFDMNKQWCRENSNAWKISSDLLGQKVATISDGELRPGSHAFDFDSHNLSAGSYFLLMQTPTVRRMERVDLQK